jgi:hypothetical protein
MLRVDTNHPVSYSGGLDFKSRSEDRLYLPTRLVVLYSPSSQVPGYDIKLGHDVFLPHPMQFIILCHHISRRWAIT